MKAILAAVLMVGTTSSARAADFKDFPAVIESLSQDIAKTTQGKTVAVTPFLPLGPNVRDKRLGDIGAELLSTKLVKAGGPKVIERAQLDKILEETKLSLLGLTDSGNATKVGQMAGADLIVVGSVSETGEFISVSVRAVDVGTSEAIGAWDARFPASTTQLLSEQYVVKKSRGDALFRSLLVPGWGQSYNGDDVKAGVFFGTWVVLGGVTAVEYVRFNNAKKDYEDAKTSPKAIQNYDSMVSLNREKGIALGALLLWMPISAAEAFVNGSSSTQVKVDIAAPVSGGSGIMLAKRF
jgi:TolB-like protein